MQIAIVGSGIAGLSAAWLLSSRHHVVLYEKDGRLGGHANTQVVETPDGPVAVDTGFLVYNEQNYPNLRALFRHLDVPTAQSDMSFSASLEGGGFEYRGSPRGLFVQKSNILRPRFWRMVADILRFYREAAGVAADPALAHLTLGQFLDRDGYSEAFRNAHILPMGAAIWSMSREAMLDFPLAVFVRFCANHGLLKIAGRPKWRTVAGGSQEYVRRLAHRVSGSVRLNTPVRRIARSAHTVHITDDRGNTQQFDAVVIATHADQAMALLGDADFVERRLLGSIGYQRNFAVLHTDDALMPRRRGAWSSWNYIQGAREHQVCVTYWLNRLQPLATDTDLFLTLNPPRPPRPDRIVRSFIYDHPLYEGAAVAAQRSLWQLQGRKRTWFCGAHFGYGFHEDGLQAGLAVAEALGGVRRPWHLDDPSDRLIMATDHELEFAREAAE